MPDAGSNQWITKQVAAEERGETPPGKPSERRWPWDTPLDSEIDSRSCQRCAGLLSKGAKVKSAGVLIEYDGTKLSFNVTYLCEEHGALAILAGNGGSWYPRTVLTPEQHKGLGGLSKDTQRVVYTRPCPPLMADGGENDGQG